MRYNIKHFLLCVLLMAFLSSGYAQCAMCRAALETSDAGIKPEAVNDGIVYLMIFPYLLVALVGYAIYRQRKKMRQKTREAASN